MSFEFCIDCVCASVEPAPNMREPAQPPTCDHVLDRISAAQTPLFWLHPPKCGSSFGSSVDAYRISAARSHELHQSLPSPLEPGAVGFFREPQERLLSAYDYIVGAGWDETHRASRCCWTEWGWPESVFVDVHRRILTGEPPNATVAPFIGCQANMLVGQGCMSRYVADASEAPSSSELLARALDAVARMRFVGLLSSWRLSICLFNVMMTGVRFVLPYQLVNTRPSLVR